jgi:hypothetical protein
LRFTAENAEDAKKLVIRDPEFLCALGDLGGERF